MSKSTLTLLTQGTVWADFRPKYFMCEFTEDTVISYIDFYSGDNVMQRLTNVSSGVLYDVRLPFTLTKIIFVPDSVGVDKKLSISNIEFDANYIFKATDNIVAVYNEDGSLSTTVLGGLNLSFNNGVGTGTSGLTPNAYVGMVLTYRGAVIGWITSNTATTVTIDRLYSSSAKSYDIMSGNGVKLLNFCAVDQLVHPPTLREYEVSASIYAAPPWGVSFNAGAIQRTSGEPAVGFVSASLHKRGIPFTTRA